MTTTNHTTEIDAAIHESILRNRIVTLDWDPETADALRAKADDSVEANGTLEYWGIDDEGAAWRVHLERPLTPPFDPDDDD